MIKKFNETLEWRQKYNKWTWTLIWNEDYFFDQKVDDKLMII